MCLFSIWSCILITRFSGNLAIICHNYIEKQMYSSFACLNVEEKNKRNEKFIWEQLKFRFQFTPTKLSIIYNTLHNSTNTSSKYQINSFIQVQEKSISFMFRPVNVDSTILNFYFCSNEIRNYYFCRCCCRFCYRRRGSW